WNQRLMLSAVVESRIQVEFRCFNFQLFFGSIIQSVDYKLDLFLNILVNPVGMTNLQVCSYLQFCPTIHIKLAMRPVLSSRR
ncbi:MAG: hypothetical protein ACWA5R_07215, partial [bacterium]